MSDRSSKNHKSRRASEDSLRFQQLLDSTEGSDGVKNRVHAEKLFAEELAGDPTRVTESAEAYAARIADSVDAARKPMIQDGQMLLFEDTQWILGGGERISAKQAKWIHVRAWADIQERNKAQQDVAHDIKMSKTNEILTIMEEQSVTECTSLQAEKIWRDANGVSL